MERLWAVSPGGASDEDFPRLRPAVLENRVFAATDSGRVIAVDEKGSGIWEQRLGLALSGGLSAGYGRIFLGTAEGELLALSAMDGKLIWRRRLSSAMLAPVPGRLPAAIPVSAAPNRGLVLKSRSMPWPR